MTSSGWLVGINVVPVVEGKHFATSACGSRCVKLVDLDLLLSDQLRHLFCAFSLECLLGRIVLLSDASNELSTEGAEGLFCDVHRCHGREVRRLKKYVYKHDRECCCVDVCCGDDSIGTRRDPCPLAF